MRRKFGSPHSRRWSAKGGLLWVVKRKLAEQGCGHLRVHHGRGTAVRWIEIYRADYSDFTEKERKAIESIFHRQAGANFFCIYSTDAEKISGLYPETQPTRTSVLRSPSYPYVV
jgi:hypothetical protein